MKKAKPDPIIAEAMKRMGRRSQEALRKRLGKARYRARMRELAQRGGEAARGKSGRRKGKPDEKATG